MESNSNNIQEFNNLVIFDFDHTIVDENSDTFIMNLLGKSISTLRAEQEYKTGHWTEFMQKIFILLKESQISTIKIKEILEKIPITPGFSELIEALGNNNNSQIIIISDANSIFIDWILRKNSLNSYFYKTFTNDCQIIDELIKISPYHSHKCETCPSNMCKKKILNDFLMENNYHFKNLIYVGDGENDYCPCQILKEKNLIFSRKDFALNKKINKVGGIIADIFYWNDGTEILNELKLRKLI